MVKYLFWFTSLGAVLVVPLISQAAPVDHLVISQVQITGGSGKTGHDFVEIYNSTASDIDLKGMRLVKRTKTGVADTLIKSWTDTAVVKSKGYYLWANSGFVEIAATPDVSTSGTLADDNGVAIRSGANDTGTIIDSVAWGEAANAFVEGQAFGTNPGPGEALSRKAAGEDANNNSQDFEIKTASPRNSSFINPTLLPLPNPPHQGEGRQTATSTPEQSSSSPQSEGGKAGGLTLEISEILPNPKGKDSGFEWVEMYNSGSAALDLSGWYIDDAAETDTPGSDAYRLPSGTKVSPFGYLLITIPKGKFSLNNTASDTILLFDFSKRLLLGQSYPGPAREGSSFARNSSNVWSWTANPTPGSANQFPELVTYSNHVIISEVFPNPVGEDSEGEFIELYNAGTEAVDLSDWIIADTSKRYVISEDDIVSAEIPAKGYLVVYREVSGINLNNSGEEQVKLYNPGGELVQTLILTSEKEGYSYAKVENKYAWMGSPTPGAHNLVKVEAKTQQTKELKTESPQSNGAVLPIALADVRKEKLGTRLETTGVVSAPPGIFDDKVLYLQGSGIRLVAENRFSQTLNLGDEIKFLGELSVYHNELELKVNDSGVIEIVSMGNAIIPHSITTGEVEEGMEGFLVKVSGAVTSSAGNTFYLDDGSGEVRIYIKDSTMITKPRTRKGMIVTVTGIVSQFDETYRVMPRFNEDIQIGAVLGANPGNLPRTGQNFWLSCGIFLAMIWLTTGLFLINKPKNLQS